MTEANTQPTTLLAAIAEAQAAAGLIEEGVALQEGFLNDPDRCDNKGGWFIAAGLKAQAKRLMSLIDAAEGIEIRACRARAKPMTKRVRAAMFRKIAAQVAPSLPPERLPAFQQAYEAEAAEHPKMIVATLAGRALARMERETAA